MKIKAIRRKMMFIWLSYLAAAVTAVGQDENQPEEPLVELETIEFVSFGMGNEAFGTAYGVTSDELARGPARSLEEVLEGIPGAQANSRAGDDVHVSLRGSGLQAVVFTKARGVDVLLDGFPISGADGNFDYSLISPVLSNQAYIYMGAAAKHLGTLTLGGAINFISPMGGEVPNRVRVDAGSFGYVRGALSQGWKNEQWDGMVQTEISRTDGFRDFSSGDAQKFAANFGFNIKENITNRTFLNYAHVFQNVALPITYAELQANPRQGRVNGPPGNFNVNALTKPYFETNTLRLANRTRVETDDESSFELGVYYLYRDIDFRRPSLPPTGFLLGPGWLGAKTHDAGGYLQYATDRPLAGRDNRLIAGLRTSGMWGDEEIYPNMMQVKGPKFADGDLWASNLTAYLQNEWFIHEDWSLVIGGQAFYSVREYKDKLPGAPNGDLRQTYSGIAPNIGFNNTSIEDIRIYGSVALNIEPPAFGDIIAIPVAPPPPQRLDLQNLSAQKAWVVELGITGEHELTDWKLVVYHSWLTNEIIRYNPPGGVATVGNQVGRNADQTRHYGLEASIAQTLWHDGDFREGSHLLVRGSYTLREHRFSGDPVFGNNRLAGVPTQFLFAELMYQDRRGFYFGPNVLGIPESFYIDNANTFRANNYTLLGVRGGWRGKNWSLFLEGSNLTDEAYAAAWQNEINAGGADQSIFFPGNGRAFRVGIEWRW